MKETVRKNIIAVIFVIFLIDGCIGYLLFKNRAFSHLAVWRIIESSEYSDFYWLPEKRPEYFRFEPDSGGTDVFRNGIRPLIVGESDEFKKILKVAKYVIDITNMPQDNMRAALPLQWGSPIDMLMQIKEGAKNANCFHKAILFSAYLSSLGIKSRLWALENNNFDDIAHTIIEVYSKNLERWIFMDIQLDFYVTQKDTSLSFLELRDAILNKGQNTITVHDIYSGNNLNGKLPESYSRLVRYAFLRADNDFVNKYNDKIRYGSFYVFGRYFDRLPERIRKGLGYSIGRKDIFIHYVDKHSKQLMPFHIIATVSFYFFIFSISSVVTFLFLFFGYALVNSLSKRDTRHR